MAHEQENNIDHCCHKNADEHEHCHCHEHEDKHHHDHEHHHDHCHCHEHKHEHHHEHEHCHCHGHEHHHEHGHHNGHEHHHESTKSQLAVIIAAAVALIAAVIVEHNVELSVWQLLLVYMVPYLIAGFGTLKEAAEGLVHGNLFNEHFLMAIATIGALCIGFFPDTETQFTEAVFVMLFFQVGELFEGYAEGKSRKSIAHLMELRPDKATVLREGNELSVSPTDIAIGETIVVRPGERIPLDAIITEGTTTLDTKSLTGESIPRSVNVGDELLSGCVNISNLVKARVVKNAGESTVSKIIDLVENAAENKSHSETFIARFARYYTPIVVIAAIAIAAIPPVIGTFVASDKVDLQFTTWFYRALMFLVVSCPCALVISVPLSFFGGIGGASRKGILVKGANYMDVLAKVNTVVFDKTGTLTHGRFAVEAVHPDKCDANRLIHLAAHVEHFSTHPIGAALRDAFPNEATDGCRIADVKEIAGHGICAKIEEETVYVGNGKLMDSIDVAWHECSHPGTIVHVAINGEYAGHIVINDQIKEESSKAISSLKRMGVKRMVMLTGDRESVAQNVAEKLALDEYHAELLPAGKVEWIKKIKQTHESESGSDNDNGNSCLFVGDGINDAPVLAIADVGIAMGGLGSDAAIEAADVVIMDDNPSKVAMAIAVARRTLRIARQNVVFAIGIKTAVLVLATAGMATMWMAVFADVGVTVLATLNAIRTMNPKIKL